MPLRIFSRSSPKTSVSDHVDASGREPPRPPLFPLQEVSWNNLSNDGKTDLLNTPRSVVKWLSSSPLPDPPFFESQENLASEKHLSLMASNNKIKPAFKDGRLKTLSAPDFESGSSSVRSSASSGIHEAFCKNPSSEQRSLNATPHVATYEMESGTNGEMQVARSLRYGQSSGSGGEGISHSGSCSSVNLTLPSTSSNSCAQLHFEVEDDPNFWKDHNVQVVIRLRPLSSSELVTQGQSRCVRQDSAQAITWIGHPESRFTFDLVACETITQEKIFKVAGLPMVDNCLLGYNSCMFAYGQTGSGKTFTMLGDLESAQHRPSINRGMTPRVFEYLFARILEEEEARSSEQLKFMCKCSFLEIYNEQILDLLEPSTANLQLREDAKRGVYVENLTEVEVKSVQDVIVLLLQGAANRKVAATNMNRESSRSHSVFTCVIESRWTSQSVKNCRFGRLHLVDLAGSERQKSSGAEGERLKEAANINKSLSTLGLVIMSLVDIANGKQRHVPYRDSKLTFLLHDSLGGNSKTTIIANISPSKCCALETLSTLKFAQRAKFIRNNAVVNENALGDVMALRLRIQRLEDENNQLRLKMMGGNVACADDGFATELATYGSLEAWDPFKEFGTPIFNSKQKNGLERTLHKTLQRQHDAEAKIKELQTEIEQFKCLVKQREEDTQRGKMMLRFREDKIKRMEALVGGLISSELYLSSERESLLEEVQILRARLERNPEVTRFAMENIRLQEELHRYQVFYEEGERDMMEKEITLLQDQLLEALDWKLMHEVDAVTPGKGQDAFIGEQDQEDTQVDKSKLEKQIETVGAVASMQAELIAMRDAVVAAKNAETEALERVASLVAEVEVLKSGLRELQEDNAKLASQKDLKELQNENAKLYEAAQGSEALAEILMQDFELLKVRQCEEIKELRNSLLVAQEELEKSRSQQVVHNESLFSKQSEPRAQVSSPDCNVDCEDEMEIQKARECAEGRSTQNMKLNGEDKVTDMTVLQEKLEQMEETNGRLSALLECAVADKEALLREITEIREKARAEISVSSAELSSVLVANTGMLNIKTQLVEEKILNGKEMEMATAQLVASGPKILSNQVEEKSLNGLEVEMATAQSIVSGPKETILSNQLVNTSLMSIEKEDLLVKLSEYEERSTKKDKELQDLMLSLKAAQIELQNVRLMHLGEETLSNASKQEEETIQPGSDVNSSNDCQEVNPYSRLVLAEYSAVITKMDEKLRIFLQNLEGKLKKHYITLDDMVRELGHKGESLKTKIEKAYMEINALLVIVDTNDLENKKLSEDLEQTTSKLRLAEKARDDACLLSAAEKCAWMEEKRALQERLATALNVCSSKEKASNDILEALELKLDLVEAKLADLLLMVDNTLGSKTEGEEMQRNHFNLCSEISMQEREAEDIEQRHHLAELRLLQIRNKVKALRRFLDGIQASKLDWCSREKRLEDHVQRLCAALAEKDMEIFGLKTEEDSYKSCLDQLSKQEERMELEVAAVRGKLQAAEQWHLDASGQSTNSAFSMLQLLRGEEEKATLLSVIGEDQDKLKVIQNEIHHLKGCIDKKETALLCAHVEREAADSSLKEAETELQETKNEIKMLLETEAELQGELGVLTSLLQQADCEEAELMTQFESACCNMQVLKKRFAQAEQDCIPVLAEIDNNVQQNKVSVRKMLLETHSCLGEIKATARLSAT